MMKYFWLAIDTRDDQGKWFAFACRIPESDNLCNILHSPAWKVYTMNVCSTKTRAFQLAKMWNHQHKINGVYAFEEP